jgi:modulator of FtsH protease HflK
MSNSLPPRRNVRGQNASLEFNSSWIIGIAIVALLFWMISTSFYTVSTEGQAVVKRFGRVIAIKQPGLHFKIPLGIDTQTFVATEKVHKEEFGFSSTVGERRDRTATYAKPREAQDESLMLTGDLKVVDVEWVVQYRISDPDLYLHRVHDVRKTIRDISEAVNRRIVGNLLGTDVLTVKRVEIAERAKLELQEILDRLEIGIRIGTIELQDVTPPDEVKPAFNEVNQAEQEKERMINEAEKSRNQVIPRARGEARQLIEEAEGYRAERVNKAEGEVEAFKAMIQEFRNAPEVTRQRLYLEMLDTVLPRVGRVIIVEPGQMGPLPLLNLDSPAIQRPQETQRPGMAPTPQQSGATR